MTRQTILNDIAEVVGIMAIISLSLAIVNLFPFLPLDGGHIFWAIVEKVRGGNQGPVGAIIGAVMKATKGQADAKRVRELVLDRIGR